MSSDIQQNKIGDYTDEVAKQLETRTLQPVLDQCHKLVMQDVRDAFTGSVSPDGEAWPERKKIGDGHPLLMDTGKLMQASVNEGAGSIAEIGDREALMGVDGSVVPYAAVHQQPVTSPIPQRKYYGPKDTTLDEMGELIADETLEVF